MADTVCANSRVTYSVRPSGLTARPAAKVSPVAAGSASVRAGVRAPSANVNSWTAFCAGAAQVQPRAARHATRARSHALSTVVVLLTVQLAMSITVSDGFASPLLVTIR